MSDRNHEAPAGIPAFRDPTDLANAVISTLQVPPEPTVVAVTYSNSRNGAAEVQAYAKIAGRNWTFYVKTLAVSIGRSTDPAPQGNTSPPTYTHIDLGPAKVVSRHHASITYNAQLRCWELQVLGRNGARVDGVKVAVGIQGAVPLHSGAILDVGGTQMMFILPDTPPSIAPKFLSSCLAKFNNETAETHKRQKLMDSSHSISSFQMFEKGAVSAVSLQNNLDQDLSREDSKDIKPPYSYATMITQAILSNPDGVMSLAEIYAWISSRYAYYKYSKTGWQNSIRHNLSLNKAFEKVPRRPNEPGKGMKWRISEAYRNDFLNKVNSGTLSKSRRGSSVSRTLQIHLATHQKLPEAKNYGSISTKSDDANDENSADSAQDHQDQQQPAMKSEGSMSNSKNIESKQIVPQQQALQPMNPGQVPQGYLPLPPKTSQDFHMPYATSGFIPRGTYPPNQHQDLREMQNYQHMQPHTQSRELASPMKHTSMDAQSMAQNHPQNVGSHVNGEGYVPGINIFKPITTSDPKQDVQFAPKIEHVSTENGRASHSNSSHLPNTSESILHQSTAPSTSNNSDIGLHFTSPKKVVPLEAFTPERGSKSMNPGARMGPHNNMGQSSPAFWNFVQFSTPNGQSPGRKNSDEDNGSESPSVKKGGDKTAVAVHNETSHK